MSSDLAVAVPHPRVYPLVGNLPQILAAPTPFDAMHRLAGELGPIFEVRLGSATRYILSGAELVSEVCDDERFQKCVPPGLVALRTFIGDGLFTVRTGSPDWGRAHRVLMPAFRREAMVRYTPTMASSVEELCDSWARRGPHTPIEVTPEMNRLTLDIIARTGFGCRFGPLDTIDSHPFVEAMHEALKLGMLRGFRPAFMNRLFYRQTRRLLHAAAVMHQTVDAIVAERRANPALLDSNDDLLSLMLREPDLETGERLSDTSARNQIITFLVAGHETSACLLSFALWYLTRNPQIQERARAEAISVLGAGPDPGFAVTLKLRYIQQILQEALRLGPPAPGFVREPREDTVIGGRYPARKGTMLIVLLTALHRNRDIWGEDADEFDPERFSPERAAGRPRGAFLPFGFGARNCLGRQFAMTEATLALAGLLRRFEIREHPSSRPQVRNNLTTRLLGLRIQAIPRG